LDKALVKLTSS